MSSEFKRKIRRGKRGGDKKGKGGFGGEDEHATQANMQPLGERRPAGSDSQDSGYVPPPMDAGDSLFYYDKGTGAMDQDDQEEKLRPASYGLVNPDLQKYLKGCEEMLDNPNFDSAEDREIFVNNVYSEMKNFELQLTTDHECSRILEKLFRISSSYQIKRFFSLIFENTIQLLIHRFSSHTVQTLLLISVIALEREQRGEMSEFDSGASMDVDEDEQVARTDLPSFEELVLKLAKEVTPMWATLMSNEYASHILRVLLLVLSGGPIGDTATTKSTIKSKSSTKYMQDRKGMPITHPSFSTTREVPESFKTALSKLLKTTSDSMSDVVARGFTNNTVGSPVLQLMLDLQAQITRVEYRESLLDKCLMDIISAPNNDGTRRDMYITIMMEDVVGSHFLQLVVKIASPKLFQTLYDRYVAGKIRKLAFHPVANFVLQDFFKNAKNASQLKAMVSEATPLFGDLLFRNRPGVVRALIDSCMRLDTGYLEIINALYGGLGAKSSAERKELINLLAFLIPYNDFVRADYNQLRFNVQGSLIVQCMLQFPGSGSEPIMDSYFAQDPLKIYSWCKDPSGSRIIDALIKSTQIPAKTKQRVIEQFSGHFSDLAMNKYGSFILDACWEVSDVDFKETILLELVKDETAILDNFFGRTIWNNYKATIYKTQPREWREHVLGLERKRSMFKDILGDKLATANVKPSAAPTLKNDDGNGTKTANKATKESNQATDEPAASSAVIDTKNDKSLEAVMSAISGTKRKSKSEKSDKHENSNEDTSKQKKSKKARQEERNSRRSFR
ncbi:Nucleolar protein 9 [Coemansia sp. Benny D115]|nr:Nucleolar protein 9 [Coemansia sp. Benny D115]